MFRFLISFTCLFVLCAAHADNQPPATGKVPTIVLLGNDANTLDKVTYSDKMNADLGTIKYYELKTVCFRFKNTGDAPGEIVELRPSCSCISGTADKMRLEPQQEATVKVVLDASLANGVFKRVLLVTTSDPRRPYTRLILRGEVIPPFHGLPESHQTFVLAEGVSWTNRFTLTETENNLFVGRPLITTDETKLRATATLATSTQGKPSYDVTLVVTPLAAGNHPLILALPVEGRPNLKPVKLAYTGHIGSEELNAVPSRIMLYRTDHPLTRQLNIKTMEQNLSTNALTWTPQHTGVSVRVQPSPKRSYLTVTLTFSSEAVEELLEEKDAQMTFNYPNYRSVSVNFFARPAPQAAKTAAATSPR